MTAIALDYTSRISPISLKAVGAVAVCRYLSWDSLAWKTIKKPEWNELNAAGIQVTLNWEADAQDWLGGAAGALLQATKAVNSAEALGAPQGQVIIGSADFNMSRAQYLSAGRAYAKTFAAICLSAGFRPGIYGPYDVLQWVHDDGLMDAFWQAGMSTSWNNGRNANRWPGAHLRQRGHMMVAGTDTDWSEILIQPLWGTPTKKEKTMRIAAITDAAGNTTYVKGDGTWNTPIMNGTELANERAIGQERQFKATDDWQGWVGRQTSGNAILTVTSDQLKNAVADNVDAIGTAVASHIKVI
jgi:hypothetical protein